MEMRNWLRQLGHNRMWDFGAAIIAALCAVRIMVMLPARASENDFAHYYIARQLLIEGANPYTIPLAPLYARHGLASEKTLPYVTDPPTLLWLFAPLQLLPLRVAFGIWVGAEVASLALILWLTRRLLRERLSARGWRFVCAGAIASATVYWHFYYAQLQLPLAAMLLVAYACLKANKPITACLIVTAAGLLKLYPFCLLPWFVWCSGGSVRTRVGRAVFALAVTAVCVWLTGWDRWVDFSRDAIPPLTLFAEHYLDSFSIVSLGAKFGSGMKLAGSLTGVAILMLSYFICLRSNGNREVEFCLLNVAMLAGTLVTWAHYFVLLIFPMAVAAVHIAANTSLRRVLFYVVLLAFFNDLQTTTTAFLERHFAAKVLVNCLPLYGLVALGGFFANELRCQPSETERPR